jgi:nucleotide-binding universal stress UspA family protein
LFGDEELSQVEQDRDGEGRIVVGVDGSPQSERAVDWALEESRTHGDDIVLVHAWQFPAVAVTGYSGAALPVFGVDDIKKLAEELLEKVADGVRKRAPDVHVDTRLVEGHPGAALVKASHGARLLVVGTRGLGGFRGLLMGSVSTSCAHHARCPLVIVPQERAP